jgi:hypothetical protein
MPLTLRQVARSRRGIRVTLPSIVMVLRTSMVSWSMFLSLFRFASVERPVQQGERRYQRDVEQHCQQDFGLTQI